MDEAAMITSAGPPTREEALAACEETLIRWHRRKLIEMVEEMKTEDELMEMMEIIVRRARGPRR